jgi:predicted DNA-binding ArsR family transcriptional regulator
MDYKYLKYKKKYMILKGGSIEEGSIEQDPDFINTLTTVQQNGLALQTVKDEFKGEIKIVLPAVRQNPCALQFVNSALLSLEDNRIIVYAAVEKDQRALQYVDKEFQRQNPDIVLYAITHTIESDSMTVFGYISEDLTKDREFMLEVVKGQNIVAVQYYLIKLNKKIGLYQKDTELSETMKLDEIRRLNEEKKRFVFEAVKYNTRAFSFLEEELQKDETYVSALIDQNWRVFFELSKDFREKQNIILHAIEKAEGECNIIFGYISENLKKDESFMLAAIKKNKNAIQYVEKPLSEDHNFRSQVEKIN